MSLKSKARLLIAGALAVTGLNIPIIDGAMKIKPLKPLKPLRKSKKPKTVADYEALHAAELKRRRKAEKRALHSNTR